MRKLDIDFIKDLKEGQLKDLLNYVKSDNTLDLEIRENYINIYYLGGNILKVTKINGSYNFSFDYNYLKYTSINRTTIINHQQKKEWNYYFPFVKQAMDFYFSKHSKEEREFQQLVVRENNYSSISNATDYFIIDIEYDNHDNSRFDLIAIEWPSVSSIRKLQKNFEPKLVIIEMKYGDGALADKSGMKDHYNDFKSFISNKKTVSEFKIEMLTLFEQKRELGLIPCLNISNNSNKIQSFTEQIELLFLIANHDPAKLRFQTELKSLSDNSIKFITSNFMGYGLYNQNIYNLEQFLSRFKKQIYEI